MTVLLGVDGCRGGWLVARRDERGLGVRLLRRFSTVLERGADAAAVAVDMPIGLLDVPRPGGRDCDRAARRLLGGVRGSSVFSPPARSVLRAASFDEVRGQGLSIQSFNLLPRILEVDRAMDPALQHRVREAHPELAFSALAGRPLQESKQTAEGRALRLHLLKETREALGGDPAALLARALASWPRDELVADDVLDALVLIHTARRVADDSVRRVPPDPPRDARGLLMEICW